MEGSVLSFLKAEWKVSNTEPLVILASVCFVRLYYILFFKQWPCLLMDRDEMSILSRGPSIDASYQVSSSFGRGVSEEKIKMWKVNGQQTENYWIIVLNVFCRQDLSNMWNLVLYFVNYFDFWGVFIFFAYVWKKIKLSKLKLNLFSFEFIK
jgi:hypothetical protein